MKNHESFGNRSTRTLVVSTAIALFASGVLGVVPSVATDDPRGEVPGSSGTSVDGHRPDLPAPGAATADGDRIDDIRRRIGGILDGVGWRSAVWSVLAVSLDNGDTLFAREPDRALAPASNMKLVTSAAALHYLGPDFRYQTLLFGDGPVRDGTLHGDLILYGTGDPGLSERFQGTRTAAFEALADRLLAAGVERVYGDLVGDGSFFQGPLINESWDPRDLNDWFAAPVSALSFNENVVTLRIEAGAFPGARPVVHTIPEGAALPLDNRARTGGRRLLIGRERPRDPIALEGGMPRGGRDVWRQITVGDPARYATEIFLRVLREKGIRVTGGVRTVATSEASRVTGRRVWAPRLGRKHPRVLARHRSPPLSQYLEVVNKESHNLLAEMVLKTVGRVVDGRGSYEGGARVLKRFLDTEVGLDTTSLTVVDGSGLSEQNRLAASDLVTLVRFMAESRLWETYWESLPEAGNPRELRRMYRTAAAGNLRAKTGTIQDVSALSGLVRSATGERIVFSILGNDLPSTWAAKRVEDRIGIQLASFDRPHEKAEERLVGVVGGSSDGAVEIGRGGDAPSTVPANGRDGRRPRRP